MRCLAQCLAARCYAGNFLKNIVSTRGLHYTAVMMRAHTRPFLLWLIALFFVHVSATYFMAPAPLAPAAPSTENVMQQKVLVCSAQGFIYVTFADLLKKGSPYTIHKADHCPFCASPVLAMLPQLPTLRAPQLRIQHVQMQAFARNLAQRELSWRSQLLRSPPRYS